MKKMNRAHISRAFRVGAVVAVLLLQGIVTAARGEDVVTLGMTEGTSSSWSRA